MSDSVIPSECMTSFKDLSRRPIRDAAVRLSCPVDTVIWPSLIGVGSKFRASAKMSSSKARSSGPKISVVTSINAREQISDADKDGVSKGRAELGKDIREKA